MWVCIGAGLVGFVYYCDYGVVTLFVICCWWMCFYVRLGVGVWVLEFVIVFGLCLFNGSYVCCFAFVVDLL